MKEYKKLDEEHFYSVYLPSDKILKLSDYVLNIEDFYKCSGSGYDGQHHYGTGGLAQHVYEVLRYCFGCASGCKSMTDEKINPDVLFLAVLYHDIGKLYDYKYTILNENSINVLPPWVPTDHKRNIHHISKSAMIFYEQANKVGLDEDIREKVLHCILSHHAKREYGSPVAPNSREAWLLALCDNMSARMNDCETWDFVTK